MLIFDSLSSSWLFVTFVVTPTARRFCSTTGRKEREDSKAL